MVFAAVKTKQKDKINTDEMKEAFQKSVKRRDEETIERYDFLTERNISKIEDMFVSEEIFNSKILRQNNGVVSMEVLEIFLNTKGSHRIRLFKR